MSARWPAHRRKLNPYNRAALAPLRMRPTKPAAPVDLPATTHRIYLLRRIHAGAAKWYPLAGWRIDRSTANANMFDFERAQWVCVTGDNKHRTVTLTEAGAAVAGIKDAGQ